MKWAVIPFERSIEYIEELDRILHPCMQGLGHVSTLPALAVALAKLSKKDEETPLSPDQQHHLDATTTRAEFAKAEIQNGFPILHAHTVIALWGALEALTFDLGVACLMNEPEAIKGDQFARIKIPLAQFEGLSTTERKVFLLKELARSLNADFKVGVGRFEVIFDALGLSGSVEEVVRRALFEMSQVRNVLVHRAGIVDQRFKDSCPWFVAEVGEKLRVDHDTYVRYSDAAHAYVLSLINRVGARSGIEPYEPPTLSKSDEGSTDNSGG